MGSGKLSSFIWLIEIKVMIEKRPLGLALRR